MEDGKKKRKTNTTKAGQNDKKPSSRTIAQASRTLQACALCRKHKTRCFRSPENPESCLRCNFVNVECSFKTSSTPVFSMPASSDNDKLDSALKGIHEILSILKRDKDIDPGKVIEAEASDPKTNGSLKALLELGDTLGGKSDDLSPNATALPTINETEITEASIVNPICTAKTSPFSIVKQTLNNVPTPISRLYSLPSAPVGASPDIITKGIITHRQVIELLDNFRRNFARWVSFPHSLSTPKLVERIRGRSSLLLNTCCCISLRFSLDTVENQTLFRNLMVQLVQDFSQALLTNTLCVDSVSGHIEFLQSLVVLSIYSLSLTSMVESVGGIDVDLNLDAWFLSSVGLTACASRSTLNTLAPMESSDYWSVLFDDDNQQLTTFRIYNHLCLVHLVNSVFSGRMCTVDNIRINYCMATLNLPSATNFDGRMVSEIGILLVAYKYIHLNLNQAQTLEECEAGYKSVLAETKAWYEQWEYLINQPAIQFVEFNYHLCLLLISYNYNYFKSSLGEPRRTDIYEEEILQTVLQKCEPSCIFPMIQHAHEAIKVANSIVSDSYFAFLSDQLHFCFYFSGVVLTTLLRCVVDSTEITEKMDTEGNHHWVTSTLTGSIVKLIDRFGAIAEGNPHDILLEYRDGLKALLEVNFPGTYTE